MGTGRDNFTPTTIRYAASRVGYRCSFPGCKNATIGASMETPSKVSTTGVAAHICAAAKGGPRYNDSMTVDERRGIENCIWLCSTHARLIDTDVEVYTVDKLKEWKHDAEIAASKALANNDFFAEYYNSNGDNLLTLTQIFDDMITDGQFVLLNTMLGQYKTKLSEHFDEFILRYRIIYSTYCCRKSTPLLLNQYLLLPQKDGSDILAELFLSFLMIEELEKIIPFCQDQELNHLASMAINNELDSKLWGPIGSKPSYQPPQRYETTIYKYISNAVRLSNQLKVFDTSGNTHRLFDGEFFYHVVSSVQALSYASFEDYGFDTIIGNNDFVFLRENIQKIKSLDLSLQEYIWAHFLCLLSENNDYFRQYHELCPDELKDHYDIRRAKYVCEVAHNPTQVSLEEVTKFSEEFNNYTVLQSLLSVLEPHLAASYLDEHSYLYRKSSLLLSFRIISLSDIDLGNPLALLEKYQDLYWEDFLFRCLHASVLLNNNSSNLNIQNDLGWLKENNSKLDTNNALLYINLLSRCAEWDTLEQLSHLPLPNECLFRIAAYLTESKDDKYIAQSKAIYERLVELSWNRQGLYYNLGSINRYFGHTELAKKTIPG